MLLFSVRREVVDLQYATNKFHFLPSDLSVREMKEDKGKKHSDKGVKVMFGVFGENESGAALTGL